MNRIQLSRFQYCLFSTNGMGIQRLPFVDWQKYVYLSFQLDYNIHRYSIIIVFHTASEMSVRDIESVVMKGAEADASVNIIRGLMGKSDFTSMISGRTHGIPHIR